LGPEELIVLSEIAMLNSYDSTLYSSEIFINCTINLKPFKNEINHQPGFCCIVVIRNPCIIGKSSKSEHPIPGQSEHLIPEQSEHLSPVQSEQSKSKELT
jgi:hypothetical protein